MEVSRATVSTYPEPSLRAVQEVHGGEDIPAACWGEKSSSGDNMLLSSDKAITSGERLWLIHWSQQKES